MLGPYRLVAVRWPGSFELQTTFFVGDGPNVLKFTEWRISWMTPRARLKYLLFDSIPLFEEYECEDEFRTLAILFVEAWEI